MITVVGLGLKENDLSYSSHLLLTKEKNIFVKTGLSQTYAYFEKNNISHKTLDFVYEQAQDFDMLDKLICEFLVEQQNTFGDLVYCVDGSGYDDRSVIMLLQQVQAIILPAVGRSMACSKPSLAHIGISAYELINNKNFDYATNLSLCVYDIDNAYIASEVKLRLSNLLGEELKVEFCGKQIRLYELDRQKEYDYTSVLYCPPLNIHQKSRYNFIDLLNIMDRLRGENGCPWDIAQTHKSIRQNAIEEAYELVQAIDNDDIDNMIEECGDVILQAVFHCTIGSDCGEFNASDALSCLCQKLIFRHTHIFGDVIANDEQQALQAWDNAKAQEKHYDGFSEKMHGIAKSIPSVMRAKKVQSVAKKAGMDFDNLDDVVDKIQEELNELLSAKLENECIEGGDLLFSIVNLLRWKNIDPEVALTNAIDKFITRFEYVEKNCDCNIKDATAQQLDKLWEAAKLEDSKR